MEPLCFAFAECTQIVVGVEVEAESGWKEVEDEGFALIPRSIHFVDRESARGLSEECIEIIGDLLLFRAPQSEQTCADKMTRSGLTIDLIFMMIL